MPPKVTYFVADKDKGLICQISIEAEIILFCVYVKFWIILLRIYSNDFLQFFNAVFFYRSSGTRRNLIFSSQIKM